MVSLNLRVAEAKSIRDFVQSAADDGYLSGRVLDYGCGKQPYRDIVVAAGGRYEGWDQISFPGNVSGEDIYADDQQVPWDDYDALLNTQVIQLADDVPAFLKEMRGFLDKRHGHLVLTYPTAWPEVDNAELWRFTRSGMQRLLLEAGFEIVRHDWRHGFMSQSRESFAAGYGAIARA